MVSGSRDDGYKHVVSPAAGRGEEVGRVGGGGCKSRRYQEEAVSMRGKKNRQMVRALMWAHAGMLECRQLK